MLYTLLVLWLTFVYNMTLALDGETEALYAACEESYSDANGY